MTVKRIQTLGVNATLATAVALSVGLAGCTPAHFDPNSPANNPAAANPSTTTPGATSGGNTGGVTTPGGITTPVATSKPLVMKGLVSLSSGPQANATISAVDAITGKPLGIVAAGAGNIVAAGAGNIVAAGAGNYRHVSEAATDIKTDAKGQYAMEIRDLPAGHVARVLATVDGLTMTTLVFDDGAALDGDAGTANLNFGTSVASQAGEASLKIASLLDPAGSYDLLAISRAALRNSIRQRLVAAIDRFKINRPTQTQERTLLSNTDPKTGKADTNVVTQTLVETNTLDTFQQLFKTVAQEFVDAKAAGKTVATIPSDDPSLKAIGVNFNNQGQFVVGGVAINTNNDKDTTKTTIAQDGTQGASDKSADLLKSPTVDKAIYSSGAFQPKAKIYYQSGSPNTTTIDVQQSAGEQDIGMIVARFSGTVSFSSSAQIGTGTTSDPKASGTGLTVDQDGAAVPTGNLPALMGGAALSGLTVKWAGHLNNSTNQVATFHVLADANYIYLVTAYSMNASYALTTAGHNTELVTHSLTLTPSSGNAEVSMISRDGQTATMLNAISTSAPAGFPIP